MADHPRPTIREFIPDEDANKIVNRVAEFNAESERLAAEEALLEDNRNEVADELDRRMETKRAHSVQKLESSWAPLDLDRQLSDGQLEQPPELLARTDGPCLLHRSKIHNLIGEPESGKGWLALLASVERIHTGELVVYIDFEDTAATLVGRLQHLGVDLDTIQRRFWYLRPDEPLTKKTRADLNDTLDNRPALVVIDGVTEAMTLLDLDLNSNSDVAKFLHTLPKVAADRGAAVLLIDHVVKNREARGRYSLGGQHKLAGVDVSYSLEVTEPFGRGRHGHAAVTVQKDRPGHIRAHQTSRGHIATFHLDATDPDHLTARLDPPDATHTFRPTILMEKLSRHVEEHPGINTRDLRAVGGKKSDAADLAARLLIDEGYMKKYRDGRAQRHESICPYRRETDPRETP